jgi:ribosomal protein S7
MIIDGATWYSEDDWKALVAEKLELEAKLVFASKMLPRAVMAILKDRKQEAIDVLETVIEELKGDSDG